MAIVDLVDRNHNVDRFRRLGRQIVRRRNARFRIEFAMPLRGVQEFNDSRTQDLILSDGGVQGPI